MCIRKELRDISQKKTAHRETVQDIYLLYINLFYLVALSQLHRFILPNGLYPASSKSTKDLWSGLPGCKAVLLGTSTDELGNQAAYKKI